MKRIKYLLVCGLMFSCLVSINLVWAESNKSEVQRSKANGWSIAWGNEIDHLKEVEFSAAVTASVACVCTAPLQGFIANELESTAERIASQLADVSKEFLIKLLLDSLKNGGVKRISGFDLEAGLATYNHWRKVIYHEPRTRIGRCGPRWARFNCPETYIAEVEREVSLPNTFQPYVRFRVR
jgi:hypothetical protein